MNKILEYLKFDFFHYKPNITYLKKPYFKTSYGILASYITLSVICLTVVFFSEKIFLRQNPNVLVTEVSHSTDKAPEISINPDELKIAFGIFESNKIINYDQSYFNATGHYYIVKPLDNYGNFSFHMIEFEMVLCPKNRIPLETFTGDLEDGELDPKFLCFGNMLTPSTNSSTNEKDFQEIKEKGYYLKGFFGSKESTQLYVGFSRCVNQTDVPGSIGGHLLFKILLSRKK